jgi:hypothetical protein
VGVSKEKNVNSAYAHAVAILRLHSLQITPTLSRQNFDGHVNFDHIITNFADLSFDLMGNIIDYRIRNLKNPNQCQKRLDT